MLFWSRDGASIVGTFSTLEVATGTLTETPSRSIRHGSAPTKVASAMDRRLSRPVLCVILVAACSGPRPSGSPIADASVEASPGASPAATSTTSSPALSIPPEATAAPTDPGRTDVVVNRDVRDRPGVPEDFYDVYWWTSFGEAGQVGTTARIGVPDGERIITAGSGLVVSAVIEFDGDVGALLRIRDIRTGALVREIETHLLLPAAVIVDRRLYWAAGLRAVGPAEPDVGNAIDGGVWAVELDRDEPPTAIVEPGTDLGSALGDGHPSA